MKLNQPAESDSEVIGVGDANKNESSRKNSKNKGKLILEETGGNSRSLRSDWENTLARKEKHPGPSQVLREVVYKLDENPEEEIHLHVDADEIHDGLQLETKADPLWEPWHAQKLENNTQPARFAEVEAQPVVEEEPASTTLVEPSLAAEALIHSQAVANIAREHALLATTPSYKDQLPKEAQEIMERLQPAKDHHIEQSTWHNIEVDNKTGRAVEEPTFSYGEAFRNEQRTEANAFHTDVAVASASGQLAVSSPIFDNLNNKDAAILTNAQTSSPPLATPRSQMDYVTGKQTSSIDPLLWTILSVIIIAIFLSIFI